MSKRVINIKFNCRHLLYIVILLCCNGYESFGQTFVFAELKGVPLNTSGWNLQGNAYVGNTGTNTGNGELILVNPVTFQSGSVFFNTPINLSQCSKWVTEFEFRIAEGTAADGLAFCYLDVPPVGFVAGGGIGIPGTANGLKVCIDTWRNCGTDAVPKVQLRWGIGYDECWAQPTLNNNGGTLNFIRSGDYHSCRIEYDNGNIRVLINNVERLTGFQTFNFLGYFGFTAATGGSWDRHSIKNVRIFTDMPPSVAGTGGAGCSGDSIQLGATTNPTYKYSWTPTTGLDNPNIANPKVALTNTGAADLNRRYYLRTEFANFPGCGSTDSVDVLVFPEPKADFSIQNTGCLTDSVRFTSLSTGFSRNIVSWNWDFGDATNSNKINPSKKYNTSGIFSIKQKVTTAEGCTAEAVKSVDITIPPIAKFSVSSPTCVGTAITFTDLSSAVSGTLVKWYWDYGDGRKDTLTASSSRTITYNTFGNYTIQLKVETQSGCSRSFSLPIAVGSYPVAAFILPEVCLNDAFAAFINTSTIADGSILSANWSWNFGDPTSTPGNPNTSNQRDPLHKYGAVGNYNVVLKVTSASGCIDSITQVLTVNGDKPKAEFIVLNATALCSNIPITIQNKSTVNFGVITKTEIYWEWPNTTIKTIDDDPVADEQYNYKYSNFQAPISKTVQVKLVAYSGGICVNEIIKTITINASPLVVFQTIPGICFDALPRLVTQASDAANLSGTGVYSGTGINTLGLFNPATAGVGTHTLQYTYTSTIGCSDSSTQEITVWPRPTAIFSIDAPTCETQDVIFRDASVANFSTIKTWNWNFGDGSTVSLNTGAAFAHVYSTAGLQNVQLQVITDSGCTSIVVTNPLQVHALPNVDFTTPVVCMPAGAAQFTDNSSIADGSQAQFTYAWNFGIAGANSSQKNPLYNYPSVGVYQVKLVVTTKDGCKDSTIKILTDVNPQPLANFSVNPASVCIGDPFTFSDQSNPLNQTITSWRWNLGDGTTSNMQNINHTYKNAGTYNVQLFYITNKGCFSDTIIKQATAHPFPLVNAGPNLFVLEGGQAIIQATATGSSSYSFAWSPASYLSNASILNPITKPVSDITYTLNVTGTGGCQSNDAVFVKVLLAPVIPNAFSPNGDGINDVWSIKYLDSYPGTVVQVFDRYGRQIFMSTGYNTPWNGRFQNKDLPVGVYYYIIDPKNGRKTITGSVTIIR